MPATVYFHEIPESRELGQNPPRATHHWVCEGIFDDFTVGSMARSMTPYTWLHPIGLTLYRQDIEVTEMGFRVWSITVTYGRLEIEVGSYEIEFDTLGGTVHVKAGVHQAVFPAGSPTHDGLIGVKGDDVEGADIVIPAMRIIVHFQHPAAYLTDARVKTLSRLAGSVDNAGFLGWDPYETLFLGAQGRQRISVTSEDVDVTEEVSYHFAMSENLTGLQIGGISGINKKGWDVAWLKWREAVESSKASNEAEYVNVVRVYREQGLAAILGFG